MLCEQRSIWSFGRKYWVVVWTYVGFSITKHPLCAPFYSNSARKAATLDKTGRMPQVWGQHCLTHLRNTPHLCYELDGKIPGVFIVPTKPIDLNAPWFGKPSTPTYFEKNVSDLCYFVRKVYQVPTVLHVPKGPGEISPIEARRIIKKYASDDLFVLGEDCY